MTTNSKDMTLHSVQCTNYWTISRLWKNECDEVLSVRSSVTVRYSSQLCLFKYCKYEERLRSLWTHLITPSRNVVEVRWRSLFWSTSLGKRCTSYNAPSTSRKRAADRWSLQNFLPQSFIFMVGKVKKSHGARSELNSVFRLEKVDRWNPIRTSAYSPVLAPWYFWAFPNMKRELRGKKFLSG
jgi:hypothetical protein